MESKLKLGELYRPKNFKEIILHYKQKVTPLKKSSHNENIIIESLARNSWMLIPLDKLQPIDITNYRDERLTKIKPSSFAREFGILRHALKIARDEWGWEVPTDLFRHIKIPKLYQRVIRRIQDKDLELISGSLLEVGVKFDLRNSLSVPDTSVMIEGDKSYVYKINEENVANKTEIKTGIRTDKSIEIISGLTEGDIIVAEGLKKVRPRGKIKPINK